MKLQLSSTVLRQFQGRFGGVARGPAAASKLDCADRTGGRGAVERASLCIAKRPFGARTSLLHRAANRKDSHAQQAQNDHPGNDATRDSQWIALQLALPAARQNWCLFGGAADHIDRQNEAVCLSSAQVVERHTELSV